MLPSYRIASKLLPPRLSPVMRLILATCYSTQHFSTSIVGTTLPNCTLAASKLAQGRAFWELAAGIAVIYSVVSFRNDFDKS